MNSEDKLEKKDLVKELLEKAKASGLTIANGHSTQEGEEEDSEDEEEKRRKSAAKGKGKARAD